MGVIHHSNHIRLFEEARVEFMRDRGIIDFHYPYGALTLAVYSVSVHYSRPAKFDEELRVYVECRLDGARLVFRYAIESIRSQLWVAHGETELVPVDKDLKVVRLPKAARESIEANSQWSAVWPPDRTAKET